MFLVQICFKSRLKQDFLTLKEYKQLFSLPRNSRWRPKGDFEGQIYISIFKVKATVFSLLSCIFVLLNSQRLICDMLRLFPLGWAITPNFRLSADGLLSSVFARFFRTKKETGSQFTRLSFAPAGWRKFWICRSCSHSDVNRKHVTWFYAAFLGRINGRNTKMSRNRHIFTRTII